MGNALLPRKQPELQFGAVFLHQKRVLVIVGLGTPIALGFLDV
tara:strand:- start:2004 stop:2132 length:129 start_codon:yes stop_codon:yes gene_type:complete